MNANVTIDRHKYIGGSDIPIIMGISPFKSRYDLLMEKAQFKEDDFEGNQYTEYGNIMEPKIRAYINERLSTEYLEDTIIKDGWRGNFDGFNGTSILEIKTTSQIKKNVSDYKVYLVQILFYMDIAGVDNGILAVYERPEDFKVIYNDEEVDEGRLKIFYVNMEDYNDLMEDIKKAIYKFERDLEKVKENPFISEEELQPNELIIISNRLAELEEALKSYKDIEAEYKDMKDKLKIAMEKEGIKKWTTNNNVQITLIADGKDSVKKVFNEKTFKEENPEMHEKYLIDKTVKGRKGYVKITLPKED